MAPAVTRLPYSILLFSALLLFPFGLLTGCLAHSMTLGVAVALMLLATWRRPDWILYGLVALAPFTRSPSYDQLRPETIAQGKTVAALLMGGLWGVRRILGEEENRMPTWLIAYLSAWLCVMGLAGLHAVHRGIALDYMAQSVAGIVLFGIAFHLQNAERRKLLTYVLLTGAAISCLALLQYLYLAFNYFPSLGMRLIGPSIQTHHYMTQMIPWEATQRVVGSMLHPNHMGAYFWLLLPFSCSLLTVKSLPRHLRWMTVGIFVLLLAGLYATNSRSAILATVCSLFYIGLHDPFRWILKAGCGALVIVGVACALLVHPEVIIEPFLKVARISSTTSIQKVDTFSGRKTIWKNAVALVKETPLLGVGPGNFPHETVRHFGFFTPATESEMWDQITTVQKVGESINKQFHAHNIYLEIAGESGLLGLLLYVTGILAVIVHCERRGRSLPVHSFARALSLATAGSAAGLVVLGVFDSQVVFTIASLNLVAGPLLAIGLKA